MKKTLISIIVPVYNVEKYISRCVESLIGQSYKNIEIILVDDGSTDESGMICEQYANKDNRIKVIHKKNGGLSDARNVAIPLSKGEYISFVDSDDWVSKFYIENLYNAITKNYSDIAMSWFENVFEDRNIASKPVNILEKYQCMNVEMCLKKMLYQDNIETSAWGKLYKRQIIEKLRYPVGKLYEDIPVTYSAITLSSKIVVIKNIDYYYFQRKDSIQNAKFNIKKMDGVKHCNDMMKKVKRGYPNLKSAAECRYISTICNILFQIRDNSYIKEKKFLWNEICKYRKNVIKDKDARKKTRVAAVLSFGGYHFLKFVYEKTQWRG